jgi:hypothetical protein
MFLFGCHATKCINMATAADGLRVIYLLPQKTEANHHYSIIQMAGLFFNVAAGGEGWLLLGKICRRVVSICSGCIFHCTEWHLISDAVQPIPPALSTSSRNKEGDILTMVLPRIK